MSTANFVHPPLGDATTQIRLLAIKPGETSDSIQCTIDVHDIDEASGDYTAISYAWGEPGNEKDIWVDGSRLSVRHNCWYALWQVRLNHEQDWHYYWLDSICINQADSREKNTQVGIMGSIFSQAGHVAACIGGAGEDVDELFSLPPYDFLNIDNLHQQRQSALRKLSLRPYFQRLWVVQESRLATILRIFCGDQVTIRSDWNDRMEPFSRDVLFGEHRDGVIRGLGLASMVELYSARKCAEVRDKLYGILALGCADEVRCIKIDYNLSLFDILKAYVYAVEWYSQGQSETKHEHVQQSILTLATQFAHGPAFVQDLRQFFHNRLKAPDAESDSSDWDSSTSNSLNSAARVRYLRLKARTIGTIMDRPPRQPKGKQRLIWSPPPSPIMLLPHFDEKPTYHILESDSSEHTLRMAGSITKAKGNGLHHFNFTFKEHAYPWFDQPTHDVTSDNPRLARWRDPSTAAIYYLVVPPHTRSDDSLLQVGQKTLLVYRSEKALGEDVVIGTATVPEESKSLYDNDSFFKTRLGDREGIDEEVEWRIRLHSDDFLSMALLMKSGFASVFGAFPRDGRMGGGYARTPNG